MVKKLDLTDHPAGKMTPPARKMFEKIVEDTLLRLQTEKLPKTINDLEDMGLLHVRGRPYDWYVSATIDAYDQYCVWLDCNPDY